MLDKWKIAIENTEYLSHYDIRLTIERLRMDRDFEKELYLLVAFYTGLNYRSIARLRWGDLLNKDEFCWTRPMTGQRFRFKWMDSDVKERILRIYGDMGKPGNDTLLLDNGTGVAHTSHHINRMLRSIRNMYCLPVHRLTTRNLQISFAKHLYETAESKNDMVSFIYAYIGGEIAHLTTNCGFVPEEEIEDAYDKVQKQVFGRYNACKLDEE